MNKGGSTDKKLRILNWMRDEVRKKQYIQEDTDAVDIQFLACSACERFEGWTGEFWEDPEIPELYFECALQIAEQYENSEL